MGRFVACAPQLSFSSTLTSLRPCRTSAKGIPFAIPEPTPNLCKDGMIFYRSKNEVILTQGHVT